MAKQDEVTHQAGVKGPGHAPELGEGAHKSKTSSWVTVALITLAFIAFGFALPMQSIALTVVGAVLLVIGLVVGFAGKIMDDVH